MADSKFLVVISENTTSERLSLIDSVLKERGAKDVKVVILPSKRVVNYDQITARNIYETPPTTTISPLQLTVSTSEDGEYDEDEMWKRLRNVYPNGIAFESSWKQVEGRIQRVDEDKFTISSH